MCIFLKSFLPNPLFTPGKENVLISLYPIYYGGCVQLKPYLPYIGLVLPYLIENTIYAVKIQNRNLWCFAICGYGSARLLEEASHMAAETASLYMYSMECDNERIKTNITLPAWLKRITEEQKVNYSRLLETALIDYLQIPMSGRQ